MTFFQQKIEKWLLRTVPERAVSQAFDLPAVVLTTDVGLHRTENQDRVAALSIDGPNGDRLKVVAVVDGMGGMRDGEKCATLALTSFFTGLASSRGHIHQRAYRAISFANDTVFKFAGGKGGATLSAIVIDSHGATYIVHLGDSRVYSFGHNSRVERLTKDDSLAEAVGGHGRELLQFVGMGREMQPFLGEVPKETKNLAITSDGIHFIEAPTLQSVLLNSSTIRSAAERLAALARWCGGPDNASGAFVDLPLLVQELRSPSELSAQIWDPFGSLSFQMKLDDPGELSTLLQAPMQNFERPNEAKSPHLDDRKPPRESLPQANTKKNNKRKRKESVPKEDIQLEIKIEGNSGEDDGDNRQ
ncbi:PP2C family protein-serine/threonine phosphatase [Rhizobium leguminosarum]|uniref:PP2C family protein-serine/threonine phosphatase n=1 Tax=Rhizobium leguminosarum TaxID=384 RepID=UPI00036EC85A|nr:protein phosphatase 2C domain-containing protein [Rhizobium leguminosarum]